jgi:hypothetical protein
MISRPWWHKLPGLAAPRPTAARNGRRTRPKLELLENRLAPAVQLGYGGPGSALNLTETVSGATPAVAVWESAPNLLTVDLGTGNRFAASSTASATGLSYNAGSLAGSQSATINISAANNVSTLLAALPGDTLAVGPLADIAGGLGNLTASASAIRVTGPVDTSHASAGNGNVDLKATGDLTVAGSPVLPHHGVLSTGTGTLSLAADVSAAGAGVSGAGALTVGAGALVTSANAGGSAVTLRGGAVHLDVSANPALVGASRLLGTAANSYFNSGNYGYAALAFDAAGYLYVANYSGGTVLRVTPGGGSSTTYVSGLSSPSALAFDAAGYLYVASNANGTVLRVPPGGGSYTTHLGGLSSPSALAFDATGNLYVANSGNGAVLRVPPGGGSYATYLSGLGSGGGSTSTGWPSTPPVPST